MKTVRTRHLRNRYRISIRQETKRYRISHSKIRTLTQKILKLLKIKSAELDILLVSDVTIRKFNRKLMNHDWATDIISLGEIEKGRKLHGNFLISLDTTAQQAKEYGNEFFYELMFYICHGILHLLGWKDDNAAKRKKMLAKQTTILKKIKVYQ